jgi:alpha-L-fucosidase
MDYKVFGVKVDADSANAIQFTTTGDVRAYVQFTQEVPEGMLRINHWPADMFAGISPPVVTRTTPTLKRSDWKVKDLCEVSHVVWKDRLCRMESIRPGQGGERKDYYLRLCDAETSDELARFAEGYGLACALVHDDVFYAFASRFEENNWNDVTLFSSKDLKQWSSTVVIQQENEHLFNSSVCKGADGFVMAYESNDPAYPAFTTKFAASPDLQHWTKLPDATFGTNRYTACPNIHYANGHYYVLYLEHRTPRWFFETYITRSSDLKHWELSAANPVISPEGTDEGINASDPDLIEYNGKTRLYYAVGDQRTWMNIKYAEYNGTTADFLEHWYTAPGIPDHGGITLSE